MKAKNTHKNSVKRDLVLLISVPVILAALLALAVYIPQLLAKPSTDFVYSTCTSYWCDQEYFVKGESIAINKPDNNTDDDPYMERGKLVLYIHDTETGSTKPLSEDEARKLKLDSSLVSPDGYVLKKNTSASDSIFGSGEDSKWELVNNMLRKEVAIFESDRYSDTVKFIGWVK